MSSLSSAAQSLPAPRVVVVVGNPRPGSRTATLAVDLAGAIGSALTPHADGAVAEVLDLAALTEQLGAPLGADSAQRWEQPLATLHAADLLIVATPTYKGSYTGLLKSFLDHVGGGALRDVTAVPVTTVGSPAHTLAAEVHLRPLLVELGASLPTEALVVGNDLLDNPAEAFGPWLERNLERLRRSTGTAISPTPATPATEAEPEPVPVGAER